jgi:hypothetical protein
LLRALDVPESDDDVQDYPDKQSPQPKDFVTSIEYHSDVEPTKEIVISPFSGGKQGITTHMFHPKQGGTNVIKNAILAAIRAAGVPGTVFSGSLQIRVEDTPISSSAPSSLPAAPAAQTAPG